MCVGVFVRACVHVFVRACVRACVCVGGGGGEGDYIIYLSVHCHHQNDFCTKVGSDENHFNVSLIVRDKVTRQCPQTTTLEEKGEPKQFRAQVLLLTSLTFLPLGQTGSQSKGSANAFQHNALLWAFCPGHRCERRMPSICLSADSNYHVTLRG